MLGVQGAGFWGLGYEAWWLDPLRDHPKPADEAFALFGFVV